MSQTLSQKYDALKEFGHLDKNIPMNIKDNLAQKINLRPYQEDAIARFLHFMKKFPKKPPYPHLLFHMATGSGKTVMMAALILDLYWRGYRNFMFFVNSTQIIEKTKENFLNPASAKFLFAPQITINNKPVMIRSVETFNSVSNDAINIHFTTIQRLHTRIQNPQENSITIEDFRDYRTVMISDEAHHLNAETKNKLNETEKVANTSWEGTVTEIFQQNSENILLEFTATADLEHVAIRKKYHDKLLFDYPLRQFREDEYSKEIVLRQAHLPPEVRMKQAVVLSQYRRKVAEAHGIRCKPVILMKSRTIPESNANEEKFRTMIAGLDGVDLETLIAASQNDEAILQAFSYVIDERRMGVDEFALEIQGDFSSEKIVNVNNLKDLEKRQIELNTLEEASNELRVIFAVDKLNEGWDVLNLFDIVRLYNTRDGKDNKVGKTTMAEAQLIGRGARYFPFTTQDQLDVAPEKRKFDRNVEHPLRILEELYYHCFHNPRYINEISNALKETGMWDENESKRELKLKKSFRQSHLYNKGYVWVNERVKNKRENVSGLADYKIEKFFSYPLLLTGVVAENSVFGQNLQRTLQRTKINTDTRRFKVTDFGKNILRFALDSNKFFHFANLRTYFPKLTGISMFMESEAYLGAVTVKVEGLVQDLDNLTSHQKLAITQDILQKIENSVRKEAVEYVGTEKFSYYKISNLFTDRIIKLKVEGEAGRGWKESQIDGLNWIDLEAEDWHAYEDCFGTDQEKLFVKYLYDHKAQLQEVYKDFYLLRNEKALKIYAFEDGQPFEPDYVLFLRRKDENKATILQLFIEPKMEKSMENERWKEFFLKEIRQKVEMDTIIQGKDYTVLGLPFFNEIGPANTNFQEAFNVFLSDKSPK